MKKLILFIMSFSSCNALAGPCDSFNVNVLNKTNENLQIQLYHGEEKTMTRKTIAPSSGSQIIGTIKYTGGSKPWGTLYINGQDGKRIFQAVIIKWKCDYDAGNYDGRFEEQSKSWENSDYVIVGPIEQVTHCPSTFKVPGCDISLPGSVTYSISGGQKITLNICVYQV